MYQLAFGNTRAAFLNLRKNEVAWLSSPPSHYASSQIDRRDLCATCGSPLSIEYLDSARMDLAVGSPEEPGALRPVSHFAVEMRIASWHAEDGLPGERFDEHARLVQRWREGYGDDVVPGLSAARGG